VEKYVTARQTTDAYIIGRKRFLSQINARKIHAFRIFIKKVKESRNRPGVAQRVPVGLGSQIS
jgi:hypothetical protein